MSARVAVVLCGACSKTIGCDVGVLDSYFIECVTVAGCAVCCAACPEACCVLCCALCVSWVPQWCWQSCDYACICAPFCVECEALDSS